MRQEKTTIFYLDHSNDFSGGQKSLLALLLLLDRSRFTPIVVIDKQARKMISELQSINVTTLQINYLNRPIIEYFIFIAPVVRIFMLMKKYRCRLLHCNTFKSGFIGAMLSFVTSVPIIFRARLGIIHLSHGFIDRIIFNRSKIILANSNYVKTTFVQRFGSSEKVKVIYNPLPKEIKLNQAALQLLKTKHFKDHSVFYFGLIGRIEPFKKLHDVVEAVRILSKTQTKFKVLFIGAQSKLEGDDYPSQLRTSIDRYSLEEKFEFTGFVSEILEITSLLNCTLLCSEGEALSRGVYESQLLGVPVIASDSGGNTELIVDEQTGLLFEVANPNSLASKMERLMTDAKLQKTVSLQAQHLIEELFNDENTILNEMNVYTALTK